MKLRSSAARGVKRGRESGKGGGCHGSRNQTLVLVGKPTNGYLNPDARHSQLTSHGNGFLFPVFGVSKRWSTDCRASALSLLLRYRFAVHFNSQTPPLPRSALLLSISLTQDLETHEAHEAGGMVLRWFAYSSFWFYGFPRTPLTPRLSFGSAHADGRPTHVCLHNKHTHTHSLSLSLYLSLSRSLDIYIYIHTYA